MLHTLGRLATAASLTSPGPEPLAGSNGLKAEGGAEAAGEYT